MCLSAEALKRSRTPLPHEEDLGLRQRNVSISAWVSEQQNVEARRRKQHACTRARVSVETHILEPHGTCGGLGMAKQQSLWESRDLEADFEARVWMIREEARQVAAMREAERTRLVQEDVRRIQAKIHTRREIERQCLLEERRKAREEEREWERHKKATVDREMTNAWLTYESRWVAITSNSDPLSFASIPWPTLSRPSSPSSITIGAISAFLLSPSHSTTQTPKERIRDALRRWHPDRFGRLLKRVPAEEKATVEEAVGVVTRYLNELLKHLTQAQSNHP